MNSCQTPSRIQCPTTACLVSGVLGLALLVSLCTGLNPARAAAAPDVLASGREDRRQWVAWLRQIAAPVLEAGAAGQLPERLPVPPGTRSRTPYASLEAVGRLLDGLAPWLESDAAVEPAEAALRTTFRAQALRAVAALVDPGSPAKVNFKAGEQIVVDAAFLAEAFLRAPRQLWAALPPEARQHVIAALVESRRFVWPL